ncbi:MAG TPA: peptide chain release factor N(5)-glutamine methyltransferase [Euzebyales bacterium]|nr:peptide chain release factor N(5)-glutamine methyltransferase [Euzebyales bacterium]
MSGSEPVGGEVAATAEVTAAELLDRLTTRFARAGIASPRADARWLVRHALGWSAAELALAGGRTLSDEQLRAVQTLADRRAAREPLQLVLGGTSVRGHPLTLRAGVFIPRPETELLVDLVLAAVPSGGRVVETCSGSGAIACAVAAERPDAQVMAIDRDQAAVELTSANAAALGVRVAVLRGELLEPVPPELRGHVDVVVANPPYLAAGDIADVEPEVGEWDPPAALIAGPTGHEVSDALIASAPPCLTPGGRLLLELDERRVSEAAARAERAGLVAVQTHEDLAGRPRFLSARRPPA